MDSPCLPSGHLRHGCPSEAAFHRAILEKLDCDGYCLVDDVPATAGDILGYARSIGSIELGIDEELTGLPVMHIRHDPEKALSTSRPAYFSNGEFPLHSDLSYVENPPRWLLTICVTPDAGGGGLTTLADCRLAWQHLSRTQCEILERREYTFANAPRTGVGGCCHRAVHEVEGARELWRFRADTTQYPERNAGAVAAFAALLHEHEMRMQLSAGQLLVIDNHRVLHGRTAFAASSARHILRAYARET